MSRRAYPLMASLALEITMKRLLACVATALACLATVSWAATPFVQVVSPLSSLANTCTAGS
jgi:hypothetical protein